MLKSIFIILSFIIATDMLSQHVDLTGNYIKRNCNEGLILKKDSSFQRLASGSWNATRKPISFNAKWTYYDGKVSLTRGLLWKKLYEYKVISYQDFVFLISVEDVKKFDNLIKQETINGDEEGIKNEMIFSHLHRENRLTP